MKKYLLVVGSVAAVAGGVMYWVKYNDGDQALSLDGVVLVIVGGALILASLFVRYKAKR